MEEGVAGFQSSGDGGGNKNQDTRSIRLSEHVYSEESVNLKYEEVFKYEMTFQIGKYFIKMFSKP